MNAPKLLIFNFNSPRSGRTKAHLWCDSAQARGIVAEPPSHEVAKVMERIARPERSEGLAQMNVLIC